MAVEIGEARMKWGSEVWNQIENFANNLKHEDTPFYIVYACKEDKGMSKRLGTPAFKQAIRAYRQKPPAILGILVWYVDNKAGKFEFVPELSAPPDIPLDPRLLSTKESDSFGSIADQGEKLGVLVS